MKTFPFHILLLFCCYTGLSQNIAINEVVSSNATLLQDTYGEFSDWVELYNSSDTEISLLNYGLSDDNDEPRKWLFPDVKISAKGFLIVFASDKDNITGNELHTNFKIKQSGEALILTNPQNEIIDLTEPVFIPTDASYAGIPDGAPIRKITITPTPGTSNKYFEELTCSHPSGFYDDAFSLEISSQNNNHKIYYTLNGSTPDTESFLYTEPIRIEPKSANAYTFSSIPTTPLTGPNQLKDFIWKSPKFVQTCNTIRFAAFENGVMQGKIKSKHYFSGKGLKGKYDFPVVSILIDSLHLFDHDSGIYVPGKRFEEVGFIWHPEGNYLNEGKDWEREMHITYFEPGGGTAFETDAGIRMHGNGSASYPQKSFKIYFRDEYGLDELDYPVFKNSNNQKFKRLLFRNGGNNFLFSHFKDAMLQKIIAPMDVDLQAFQPSVVFINGEYWGIHNIRDKYDRFHFKNNFGIDKDEVNLLDVKGRIEEGDNSEYLELIDFVNNEDLSVTENYEHVEKRVDISALIDFQIAEIYFANYDWPCNNYKIWKSNDEEAKWRFAIYDLDLSFGHDQNSRYDVNSMKHATTADDNWPFCQISNAVFRNLLENEKFKNQFIDRFAYCQKHIFEVSRVLEIVNEFKELYTDEMPEHIARWNYPNDMNSWEKSIENIKEFALKRPCVVSEDIIDFFDLTTYGFDCSEDSGTGSLSLFPNPNHGNFFIFNDLPESLENARITIFNSSGQLVFEREEINVGRKERFPVKLTDLPYGLYIVILEGNNYSFREKLILRGN